MDYSLSSSLVHGLVQARTLEWVVIPLPGNLPEPAIDPGSPALQANSLPSELLGRPVEKITQCNPRKQKN